MLHQSLVAREEGANRLAVERVSISAGHVPIVKEISFSAKAGELLAIIGPSGSGKTTLLRAITGEIAYSGQVFLAGQDVSTLPPERQAELRAVLPQAGQISFPLNVSEVIGLGFRDRRMGRQEKFHRIGETLSLVGLPGFQSRAYHELSGGEQQRVQLARVLCQVWDPLPECGVPCWLFLDEPVSSLDIKHQYQIMQLAADYAARGGGVVAVMHDLNLTAAFADKVLIMRGGKSLAFGTPDEVMRAELLTEAYDFPLSLSCCGETGRKRVVPGRFSAK